MHFSASFLRGPKHRGVNTSSGQCTTSWRSWCLQQAAAEQRKFGALYSAVNERSSGTKTSDFQTPCEALGAYSMHPGTLRTWLNPSKRELLLHTQRLFSCCCTDAFACLPSDFKSPVSASVHGVGGCRRYHEPVSQDIQDSGHTISTGGIHVHLLSKRCRGLR